jgi:predicted MFS family arabinose efflux permease
VTVPGLVAALAALLVPAVVRHADRGRALVGLMTLLAAANALTALAPAFPVLLAARLLVGVCIGGVWAIAASLPARLVPPERAARATALVFGGIAVASVLGVPAGTLLGDLAGWRASFGAAAGLSLLVALALARALPPLPAREPAGAGALTRPLRIPAVRAGLLVLVLLVTGHFAAYTYVRPALERGDGVGAETVGVLLLVYGTAGVAGNFAAGALAARDPRRTLTAIAAVLAATVLTLGAAGGLAASAALTVTWGLAYGGVSVSLQNWLSAAAPQARETVSALFAGAFNASIGAGALLGGVAAGRSGASAPLWLGGALAAAALLVAAGAGRAARP